MTLATGLGAVFGLSGEASAGLIYRRLLDYVRPYRKMFAFSILGMLVFALTEPLFAAMIKPLLDGSFV